MGIGSNKEGNSRFEGDVGSFNEWWRWNVYRRSKGGYKIIVCCLEKL